MSGRQRVRTNLGSAINMDPQTKELWITAGYKMPPLTRAEERQTPSEAWEDYEAHCQRKLDYMMNDAIADAINDYWVVLPPIQARIIELTDTAFGYTTRIAMRRVRVIRGTLDEHERLVAIWALDPIDPMYDDYPGSPWVRYQPLYDEEKVKA